MNNQQDPAAIARTIVDSNLYMALGTSDASGRPWVSPVYYAAAGYTDFYWVSRPDTTHSRNIATRHEVSIVIFDSRAPIGTGQAVYMSALAREVTGVELDRGIDLFSRSSQARGAREWTLADVQPPAHLRLFRATASEHWVLDPTDHRIPVTM
jgi:pyridoxamine 5'-phosphate oxidase-like protein